jgi:hypothetical protein
LSNIGIEEIKQRDIIEKSEDTDPFNGKKIEIYLMQGLHEPFNSDENMHEDPAFHQSEDMFSF